MCAILPVLGATPPVSSTTTVAPMIWSRVWHLTEINMFSWRSAGIKGRNKTKTSPHELPVIIKSTKGLEAVSWFRIGESRFQLQSNPVNISRIPHCILVKSRIPNPGEYRVLDFLSTATSTQIPNHDIIKKRCNINKQHNINKPRQRKLREITKCSLTGFSEIQVEIKPARCSQDL